jgi:toxin-antitoxin system PIN domain toxin
VILPDVNIIVQAFRSDTRFHALCRNWLEGLVNGEARFGMSPQVLSSVVRITTHPKVFVQPSDLQEVLHFCTVLLNQPHGVIIQPNARHWDIFKRLCLSADARGNLAPDAWFAALAIESGCEWVTLDRDYARFPGLGWRVLEG